MPPQPDIASRNHVLAEINASEMGYSYVCRRCDVWGRVPAGAGRRCWSCGRTDRLDRR